MLCVRVCVCVFTDGPEVKLRSFDRGNCRSPTPKKKEERFAVEWEKTTTEEQTRKMTENKRGRSDFRIGSAQ